MADTHGSADSDFDLTQFYQVFFEEAAENLDQMEQMLLNLDLTQANDEELNGIFRCAHSIKGGSATFGFTDVAELTHKMESLLDRLRRHEITPIPEMVDALLESADASRSLLARHQAGGGRRGRGHRGFGTAHCGFGRRQPPQCRPRPHRSGQHPRPRLQPQSRWPQRHRPWPRASACCS